MAESDLQTKLAVVEETLLRLSKTRQYVPWDIRQEHESMLNLVKEAQNQASLGNTTQPTSEQVTKQSGNKVEQQTSEQAFLDEYKAVMRCYVDEQIRTGLLEVREVMQDEVNASFQILKTSLARPARELEVQDTQHEPQQSTTPIPPHTIVLPRVKMPLSEVSDQMSTSGTKTTTTSAALTTEPYAVNPRQPRVLETLSESSRESRHIPPSKSTITKPDAATQTYKGKVNIPKTLRDRAALKGLSDINFEASFIFKKIGDIIMGDKNLVNPANVLQKLKIVKSSLEIK
ncbi:hypothetical protein LTR66_016898 [Elasticomyces elasticus]|nr:hypothetical protein LTR66_016898 [Elasticomyces elasticus]